MDNALIEACDDDEYYLHYVVLIYREKPCHYNSMRLILCQDCQSDTSMGIIPDLQFAASHETNSYIYLYSDLINGTI